MKNAGINKVLCFLIFITVLLSCTQKRKETPKALPTPKKEITCDINEDGIKDTLSLKAIKKDRTFDFSLTIKYSSGKGFRIKKFYSENRSDSYSWGISSSANWIEIGYADNSYMSYFFELSYDKQSDRFLLRNFYKVNDHETIKQNYKIFDMGKIPVELYGMSVCRQTFAGFPMPDTLNDAISSNPECIKIPYYSDSQATEENVAGTLGLVKLKKI